MNKPSASWEKYYTGEPLTNSEIKDMVSDCKDLVKILKKMGESPALIRQSRMTIGTLEGYLFNRKN